ncbi:MAG: ribbon-helix-helix domain-containing protein [Hyphomicrobiaceae bacterium]
MTTAITSNDTQDPESDRLGHRNALRAVEHATRPLKRSFRISGHETSISLEPDFWSALSTLAEADGTNLTDLVAEIDRARRAASLSGAVRAYVLARAVAGSGDLSTNAKRSARD